MKHRRKFITRKSTDFLKYSKQSKSICEVADWREEKCESTLSHLRIIEIITVFIGKNRCRSEEIRESVTRIFLLFR